ncbi:MAG TPA: phosphatase PAP2-related protein [Flavisolibacter sp.]|nr:phosphatase PAP2-related protein [Flavisolibacter sp.]
MFFYFASMELTHLHSAWPPALKNHLFRSKLIAGLVVLIVVVVVLPFFFQYIEQRDGYVLNDALLNILPSTDVSIPIFAMIWSMVLLFVMRSIGNPRLFITYLFGFLFLCLCRIVTLSLVPLNPPIGIKELQDPLTNFFYGSGQFITKDLFFSGHTATLCLLFFCFQRKWDKIVALICTIAVGFLVLVQHVHYLVDVLAAPPFTFLCFMLAKKVAKFEEHHADITN